MLIIRYRRSGKRNKPHYKIVVAEKSSPVKGKFVELVGSYSPHSKEVSLKKERINYWVEKGAQCSDSVHNLLVSKGILKDSKRKINVPLKEESKQEQEEEVKEKSSEDEGGVDEKEKAESEDKTKKENEDKPTEQNQQEQKEKPAK
ncbi:MAG: 30S ribosomal protein S16 [Candidatus Moraniibacteriota bacterium]